MEGVTDEIKTALSNECVFVHQEVMRIAAQFLDQLRRYVYITPKSYLDLINLYLEMIDEKRTQLTTYPP